MRSVTIVIAIFLFQATCLSATYYVPDDFVCIQDAITACVNGDTVIVRAGTYVENLDFLGKAVTLMSESGPTVTTIDGGSPANPDFGKALVGAWYEVMGLMAAGDEEVLTAMAEASGTDLAGYQAQLASTEMFYTPADAVAFTSSPELPATMVSVAEYLFDKGILGEGAPSADFVGVAYPDGSTTGDAGNVMFRYDTTYMQMAADGDL